MSEIELLLEVGASRRIIKATRENLVLALERGLGNVGLDGVLALLPSTSEDTSKTIFVLQRWTDRSDLRNNDVEYKSDEDLPSTWLNPTDVVSNKLHKSECINST